MRQIKIPLLILLMIFGLFSCQKDELNLGVEKNTELNGEVESTGKMVLGDKLENPYSVKNMKKAYESLKSNATIKLTVADKFEVNANTLYIRFLPKDSTDLRILWADTTIELFDFPLDYGIVKEGFYYHDPEIPEGQPTWQYTSVPIDYKFPNVQYEIIEVCYIPEANEEDLDIKSAHSDDFYGQLELESFRLTGNLNDENNLINTNATKGKNKPKGTIKVNNTSKGLEGVMKVKVRVHNFVKWDTDYTDEKGNYKMSKNFRTNIHYAVVFENATGFKIWGNWAMFSPAIYNMKWHSNSGYDKEIDTLSKAWLWSTVNNGTYYYREKLCPKFGISKPPSNIRIWTLRTGGKWGGCAPMARQITLGINNLMDFLVIGYAGIKSKGITTALSLCMPDIFLFQNYTNTKDCYSTLWHELSHASHYHKVGKWYWLNYITAISTQFGYGDGSRSIDGYIGVGEMWGNYFGNYVCCDDYFGSSVKWDPKEDWYNPGFLLDVDNISDVTTSEIFGCLTSDIHSVSSIKDKLKTITNYDSQVDNAYNKTAYNDWP